MSWQNTFVKLRLFCIHFLMFWIELQIYILVSKEKFLLKTKFKHKYFPFLFYVCAEISVSCISSIFSNVQVFIACINIEYRIDSKIRLHFFDDELGIIYDLHLPQKKSLCHSKRHFLAVLIAKREFFTLNLSVIRKVGVHYRTFREGGKFQIWGLRKGEKSKSS